MRDIIIIIIIIIIITSATAIGLSPGGSSPTPVQRKPTLVQTQNTVEPWKFS
jgi:hypothetical protein